MPPPVPTSSFDVILEECVDKLQKFYESKEAEVLKYEETLQERLNKVRRGVGS